jgi:hypothetical protein
MGYLGTKPANSPLTSELIPDGLINTSDLANGAVSPTKLSTGAPNWDTSGNLGIGTSSPATYSSRLAIVPAASTVALAIDAASGNNTGINWYNNASIKWATQVLTTGEYRFFDFTASSERMRIDNSGNLLVGTTSAGQGTKCVMKSGTGQDWGVGPIAAAANNFYVVNTVGTGVYLASGNTSWTANSDERLKTTLKPFENAAEKVSSLRAGTGRYLTDDESISRSFLIAQDVQKVLPEAINIQNDEIGTLGLQYTDVIPLLVAAIKEQQTLITALTARITVLEAK